MSKEIGELEISSVSYGVCNLRNLEEDEEIEELMASIQEHGVKEPILVRPKDNGYEVVHGHRVTESCRRLGKTRIPATIVECDDGGARILWLTMNLHQKSLEPWKVAEIVYDLYGAGKFTQEELGRKLGKGQSWVSQRHIAFKLRQELSLGLNVSPTVVYQVSTQVSDEEDRDRVLRNLDEGRMRPKQLEDVFTVLEYGEDFPDVKEAVLNCEARTQRAAHHLNRLFCVDEEERLEATDNLRRLLVEETARTDRTGDNWYLKRATKTADSVDGLDGYDIDRIYERRNKLQWLRLLESAEAHLHHVADVARRRLESQHVIVAEQEVDEFLSIEPEYERGY